MRMTLAILFLGAAVVGGCCTKPDVVETATSITYPVGQIPVVAPDTH